MQELPLDSGAIRAFRAREPLLEFLRMVQEPESVHDLVRKVSGFLHRWSGCEAVGVRLREGDDFPYCETRGFPEAFVAAESSLCATDARGVCLREMDGSPLLECMCGNILRGRFDPELPFFTRRGSFWTNSTTQLLASSTPEQRQARTRNRCNGEGYESVALIPLRSGATVLGLIQLNDLAPGRFSLESVTFLEEVADQVALAISRRQAQDALATGAERFLQILESTDSWGWELDAEGMYTYVTQNVRALLGYAPEELVGRLHSFDLFGPGMAAAPRNQVLATFNRHEAFRNVFSERVHKDGHTVFMESSAIPILDEQGVFRGYRGASKDISSRHRAELEVNRLHDLLRASQSMAQVGGWEIDLADMSLAWTDETYRLHDTSPAEYRPSVESSLLFYTPESAPLIRSAVQRSIQDFSGFDLELEKVTAKGRRIWVRVNGRVVLEQFRVVKVLGAFQDITLRRQAEADLRHSEATFRSYIENLPMGIFITDTTGRFLRVNPAASRITGYVPEELQEMHVLDLFLSEDRAGADAVLRACLDSGHGQGEFPFRHQDGHLGYCSVEAVRLSPVRLLGFMADISERKTAEAMVGHMTEELEQRVRERTAQLEASNRELEAFSYSVSHDLRGPLRGIDGFSGALLSDYRDHLDPTGQHYLTRIRQGAQRMGQLIEDLLKLSRINRNGLELTIVNMSGLCHQVVGELLRANAERPFQVVIEPGMVVRADRRMLQMVLENLLGNAWKFTARNAQPRVEVGATTRTDGSPCWFIQDNGAGFDMEYAGKLFQPFQRLHADTDYEGTGIGLAIVQRIIRRHGGEVWAEAMPGLGATFYFSLPGLET